MSSSQPPTTKQTPNNNNNESGGAEANARKKDASREGRLSFKNFGEHQLRRDFKDQAIEKCRSTIDAFGSCAKDNGLMVVIRCRQFNKDVVSCMEIHNSNEKFDVYKETHLADLIKKTPGLG
eukprot:CAMPEP_0198249910 /NCGR_PEP_ID=MMETSP1447-20131203/1281_1 /TAXON_ID=420782 /ORGANISM="Chaetoceros dichaeta, Strain CCMP1751" /LENGTH=121 /DNA_ID=CAMNT_0043934647 /DNA_START=102 /DNA_END=467 /DNA_ORIENTATION=+